LFRRLPVARRDAGFPLLEGWEPGNQFRQAVPARFPTTGTGSGDVPVQVACFDAERQSLPCPARGHCWEGSDMALRSGHGTGVPRVEVLPVDELPDRRPDDSRPAKPSDRGAGGRFAPGNALARRGGQAKRGRARLTARLGLLANLPDDSAFAAYRRDAATFRRVQCAAEARTVGGGVFGPSPSSVVTSAALALAWSRCFSDLAAETGDPELAPTVQRLPVRRRAKFTSLLSEDSVGSKCNETLFNCQARCKTSRSCNSQRSDDRSRIRRSVLQPCALAATLSGRCDA